MKVYCIRYQWEQIVEAVYEYLISECVKFFHVKNQDCLLFHVEPNEKDKQMLNYLYHYQIPFSIIATKTDKISKNLIIKNLNIISSVLSVGRDDIIATSSVKKDKLDAVWDIIEQDLKRVCNGS